MNDITLGKCPFCGGKVSSAVESRHKGALVAYWCARPVCENGCPVGKVADGWDDLHVGYGGDPGPDVVKTDLANKWGNVCDTASPIPVRVHIAAAALRSWRPMRSCASAVPTMGSSSPKRARPCSGWSSGGTARAAAAESAGRRQAELEKECEILNRAFWPERLRSE